MAYSDNEHLHIFGVLLEFSPDGTTYTAINDLASVEGPEYEWSKSDDTTLQSPNRIKLITTGWMTAGQLKFTSYFNKVQFATLHVDYLGRAIYWWRITLPKTSAEVTSGEQFVAKGYLIKCKPVTKAEKGSDDKFMVEYEVELTTAFTLTAGA